MLNNKASSQIRLMALKVNNNNIFQCSTITVRNVEFSKDCSGYTLTKVLLPQPQLTLAKFGYLVQVLWVYCSQNTFMLFGFPISRFRAYIPDESYSTKFYIYVFIRSMVLVGTLHLRCFCKGLFCRSVVGDRDFVRILSLGLSGARCF